MTASGRVGDITLNKWSKFLLHNSFVFYFLCVLSNTEDESVKSFDPARTRTWNPLIRSQMPYPLGHRAMSRRKIIDDRLWTMLVFYLTGDLDVPRVCLITRPWRRTPNNYQIFQRQKHIIGIGLGRFYLY